MIALIYVGIGGFLGAISRWSLGSMLKKTLGDPSFPYPTLLINLIGCFAIGLAYAIWENNKVAQLFIIIGFLGGFTTFSTFGLELLTLIRADSLGNATKSAAIPPGASGIVVWLQALDAGTLTLTNGVQVNIP